MGIATRFTLAACVVLVSLGHASSARAQVFELIDSFEGCPSAGCGENGDVARPSSRLHLGRDGFLYGATGVDWRPGEAAPRSWGSVYRISTSGERTILRRFTGESPA